MGYLTKLSPCYFWDPHHLEYQVLLGIDRQSGHGVLKSPLLECSCVEVDVALTG